MRVKKASKGQNFLSFIISILLMLSTIVSILSLSVNFIILNPNTYYNILEKRNIYNEIYNVVDNNISYALTLSNLSQDIKKDIISENEVKSEVKGFVRDIIKYLRTGINNVSKVNIDTYMERFDKNLNEFFQNNSIVVTNEIKSEINSLENDVKQIIQNELQIVNVEAINNNEIFNKVTKITSLFTSKLYFTPIIFVVVLILLLFAVWRSDYVRLLQWIGNSFISSGLMIFLIFFSGYISKFYEYISINTIYLKNFVSSIIKSYLGILSLWGVFVIIIGVILIIPKVRQSIKISKMKRK